MSEKTSVNDAYEILKSEIENRKYAEDEKFSTEAELMDRFGLSRSSIRVLLSKLVSSNLLYRKKNRGVYINRKIINNNSNIRSFSQRIKDQGRKVTSKVMEIRRIVPPDMARLSLGLTEGEFCYYIKRLRFADGEPLAVETVYTPASLFPDIRRFDFSSDSFYRILREELHLSFSYNKEIISAVEETGEVARLLYNADRGITLKIVNVLYDVNYKPLEYSECWFDSTKYTYLSISVDS